MRALRSFVLAGAVLGFAGPAPRAAMHVAGGELHFSPDAPRPGDSITVSYRPAAPLAGRARVILRGRIRTQHSNRVNEPPITEGTDIVTIATLRRGDDGRFAGTFLFPDSALHMSFALENVESTFVDSNLGRYWELMAHETDGRPSLEALEQRLADLSARNSQEQLLTSRQMTALYPDRAQAWYAAWLYERAVIAVDKADSVNSVYIAKGLELARRLPSDTAALRRELPPLARFAYWLRSASRSGADSAALEPWITRAIREYPAAPEIIELRWSAIYRTRRSDLTQALADFETVWQAAGDSLYRTTSAAQPRHQFSRGGWRLAMEAHDTAAYLRWMERVAVGGRYARRRSALLLADVPGTRREGMRWIRDELHAIDAMRPEHRFLGETIDQQRTRAKEEARLLMAALGKALIATGARAAGLDTLTRAASGSWDLETFQLIAEGRMAAGDTAGALAMQARIAADPRTAPTLVASLEPLAERSVGGARWKVLLADGRAELTRRVLARAIDIAPTVPTRLTDSTGKEHSFAELSGGKLTFVHYWTRDCGDAMAELSKADSVAQRLAAMGVRVLSVTLDELSPKTDEVIRKKRLTGPVYHDLRKTIEHGFNQWSSPAYLLIDANGRLRYQVNANPDQVMPYALALGGTRPVTATPSSRRR